MFLLFRGIFFVCWLVRFDSLLLVFKWVELVDYFHLLKITSCNANTDAHSEIQTLLMSTE